MAHQSLYRTYRPAAFSEVRGQEQILKALQEQIATKKIGHAYLFSGSRGLGKTSIARIFALELGTTNKDLYEIDAASNNSVDDIRQLTENVYTLPFESPYKVYILDEAHMLSKGAWNAFLKTLEEPPAHVVFILATTELSKIPETVLSRCQVYEFKKPSRAGLAQLVIEVSKDEGYTMEPLAADLIALLGDGSYRDSLSVLEKVLASVTEKTITREAAEIATGAPRSERVHALITALHEGNAEAALATVREVSKQGIDMGLYLSLVLEEVRMVLLIRTAPELRTELNATERQRFSPIPSLPLELALYEILI
jgi:DNA polymerase-3 subunit gamma/tau